MADRTDSYTLVRAGGLIDGQGGPPIPNGAVLLRGSVIEAVGRQGNLAGPEGAYTQVLDFPDKTVMPGMVDCHTHHNGFGDGRLGDTLADMPDEVLTLQSARNARTALFSGVTSIRENGPKNVTMFRPARRHPGRNLNRPSDGALRPRGVHNRWAHGLLRLGGHRPKRGPAP